MICAHPLCGGTFTPARDWQRYCNNRCQVNALRYRARKRQPKPPPPPKPTAVCARPECGETFTLHHPRQVYCSTPCRTKDFRSRAEKRAAGHKRKLRCHWCRGQHFSADCGNRDAGLVKVFGTVDPVTRKYVPPPGVRVRFVSIPNTVHGDTVGDYLEDKS